jgi:hypothetical protein
VEVKHRGEECGSETPRVHDSPLEVEMQTIGKFSLGISLVILQVLQEF